jgi:small-conductance mechanosensitive channel
MTDELIQTIPNAKLEGIAVSNLSRYERCQVKQTLRFHYKDVHALPKLLEAIKTEIIDACKPHIVTDGSRPCRVVWTGYNERWLEVLVDVHFEGIKPIGNKYWNNRQKVLMAIQRAVDQQGVEFAILQSSCECCKPSS